MCMPRCAAAAARAMRAREALVAATAATRTRAVITPAPARAVMRTLWRRARARARSAAANTTTNVPRTYAERYVRCGARTNARGALFAIIIHADGEKCREAAIALSAHER